MEERTLARQESRDALARLGERPVAVGIEKRREDLRLAVGIEVEERDGPRGRGARREDSRGGTPGAASRSASQSLFFARFTKDGMSRSSSPCIARPSSTHSPSGLA